MPDEVAQRVGDQFAVCELHRLQHMGMVTDDGVGAGVEQLPSEVARRDGLADGTWFVNRYELRARWPAALLPGAR